MSQFAAFDGFVASSLSLACDISRDASVTQRLEDLEFLVNTIAAVRPSRQAVGQFFSDNTAFKSVEDFIYTVAVDSQAHDQLCSALSLGLRAAQSAGKLSLYLTLARAMVFGLRIGISTVSTQLGHAFQHHLVALKAWAEGVELDALLDVNVSTLDPAACNLSSVLTTLLSCIASLIQAGSHVQKEIRRHPASWARFVADNTPAVAYSLSGLHSDCDRLLTTLETVSAVPDTQRETFKTELLRTLVGITAGICGGICVNAAAANAALQADQAVTETSDPIQAQLIAHENSRSKQPSSNTLQVNDSLGIVSLRSLDAWIRDCPATHALAPGGPVATACAAANSEIALRMGAFAFLTSAASASEEGQISALESFIEQQEQQLVCHPMIPLEPLPLITGTPDSIVNDLAGILDADPPNTSPVRRLVTHVLHLLTQQAPPGRNTAASAARTEAFTRSVLNSRVVSRMTSWLGKELFRKEQSLPAADDPWTTRRNLSAFLLMDRSALLITYRFILRSVMLDVTMFQDLHNLRCNQFVHYVSTLLIRQRKDPKAQYLGIRLAWAISFGVDIEQQMDHIVTDWRIPNSHPVAQAARAEVTGPDDEERVRTLQKVAGFDPQRDRLVDLDLRGGPDHLVHVEFNSTPPNLQRSLQPGSISFIRDPGVLADILRALDDATLLLEHARTDRTISPTVYRLATCIPPYLGVAMGEQPWMGTIKAQRLCIGPADPQAPAVPDDSAGSASWDRIPDAHRVRDIQRLFAQQQWNPVSPLELSVPPAAPVPVSQLVAAPTTLVAAAQDMPPVFVQPPLAYTVVFPVAAKAIHTEALANGKRKLFGKAKTVTLFIPDQLHTPPGYVPLGVTPILDDVLKAYHIFQYNVRVVNDPFVAQLRRPAGHSPPDVEVMCVSQGTGALLWPLVSRGPVHRPAQRRSQIGMVAHTDQGLYADYPLAQADIIRATGLRGRSRTQDPGFRFLSGGAWSHGDAAALSEVALAGEGGWHRPNVKGHAAEPWHHRALSQCKHTARTHATSAGSIRLVTTLPNGEAVSALRAVAGGGGGSDRGADGDLSTQNLPQLRQGTLKLGVEARVSVHTLPKEHIWVPLQMFRSAVAAMQQAVEQDMMHLVPSALHLAAQLRRRYTNLGHRDLAAPCWSGLIAWVAELAYNRERHDCPEPGVLTSVHPPVAPSEGDAQWAVGAASHMLSEGTVQYNISQISADLLVFLHPYPGNWAGRYARPSRTAKNAPKLETKQAQACFDDNTLRLQPYTDPDRAGMGGELPLPPAPPNLITPLDSDMMANTTQCWQRACDMWRRSHNYTAFAHCRVHGVVHSLLHHLLVTNANDALIVESVLMTLSLMLPDITQTDLRAVMTLTPAIARVVLLFGSNVIIQVYGSQLLVLASAALCPARSTWGKHSMRWASRVYAKQALTFLAAELDAARLSQETADEGAGNELQSYIQTIEYYSLLIAPLVRFAKSETYP